MNKVLVDRELLEQIVNTNMADYAVIAYQRKEIRFILEAQPAEAEGVEVVAWQQRYICPDEGPSCWQSADERTVEILRRRDDYELRQLVPLTALSAVTAERDRLREDIDECDGERWKLRTERDQLLAELKTVRAIQAEMINARNSYQWELERVSADVEALRPDAERYRWLAKRDRWASLKVDFDRHSTYRCHRVVFFTGDDWPQVEGQTIDEAVDAAMAAKEA